MKSRSWMADASSPRAVRASSCASISRKSCWSCPNRIFRSSARTCPAPLRGGRSVEITTDDLETTLRVLLDAQVPLTNLRIRPPNLEDLFLELTGKELRT
jgi:hypothetical protein